MVPLTFRFARVMADAFLRGPDGDLEGRKMDQPQPRLPGWAHDREQAVKGVEALGQHVPGVLEGGRGILMSAYRLGTVPLSAMSRGHSTPSVPLRTNTDTTSTRMVVVVVVMVGSMRAKCGASDTRYAAQCASRDCRGSRPSDSVCLHFQRRQFGSPRYLRCVPVILEFPETRTLAAGGRVALPDPVVVRFRSSPRPRTRGAATGESNAQGG